MKVSSAFNFDLTTGAKSEIENANWMAHWTFKKLAHFQSNRAPDVTYTYLTCLECEPEEIFSTFRFNIATHKWEIRNWETDRKIWWTGQNGIVVDEDLLEGETETLSFNCLYGVIRSAGQEIDAVANRCQEVTELDERKKLTTDVTVLYQLDGEALKIKPMTSPQEVADVTDKLCEGKIHQAICKLPPSSTYNSPKLTLLVMFPSAPKTARSAECFRSVEKGSAMYSIVQKCGRPDAVGGSVIGFFSYKLDDGSKITIHYVDDQHIQDVTQTDSTGKTKTLVANK